MSYRANREKLDTKTILSDGRNGCDEKAVVYTVCLDEKRYGITDPAGVCGDDESIESGYVVADRDVPRPLRLSLQ